MKERIQVEKKRNTKCKESIWTKISRFFTSNSLEAYGFSKRDIKRVLEGGGK